MKRTTVCMAMVMAAFVWAGMVAGISFLEAPVKFTAPHVTLAIGLGIGRLVFGLLNKFEILFCATILCGSLYMKPALKVWLPVSGLTLILLLQTFWLLPALDVRALTIIAGLDPGESALHLVYVVLEIIKLTLLFLAGIRIFRSAVKAQGLEEKPKPLKAYS